jgi:hypothetical protein
MSPTRETWNEPDEGDLEADGKLPRPSRRAPLERTTS